jgi:O-antigen/teichoic acid export membrane protein
MFSIVGILAYIVIAYFVGIQSNANVDVILFSVILIPFLFLSRTLTVINQGWKPQAASYGLIGFEIAKIPAGLILVYFLDMGLEGAIIATVISYSISIIILFYFSKEKILVPFKKEFVIKWIKLSWFALYSGKVYSMIQHFDVAVFSLIVGNVVGLAYWTSAFAISSIVAHSSSVSEGLYGKLLGGSKKEYFQENFRLVLYFIIPLFAFAITFARPGLFTLNPIYETAVLVVIFLSIHMLVQTFNNIFNAALWGIEKVDTSEKINLKEYVKSNLFSLATLTIIQRVTYIVSLAVILFLTIGKSDLELVINWSIVAAIVPIPFMLYRLILVRKNFSININYFIILKYIISAIVIFGITYFLMDEYLTYNEQIILFFPQILFYLIFSVGGYIGITFLIDSNTKQLVKAVFNELKSIQR